MNSVKKNLASEIFVIATGVAALIHSTWSIGTLFSGVEPSAELQPFRYLTWLIPALLVAFALDIGQIATSHQIGLDLARGERPRGKYVTFVVFAVSTYYLQWLYMAHHIPTLELGAGIGITHREFASNLRDLAVWVVPAFLPLSTMLYTFSRVQEKPAHTEKEVYVEPAYTEIVVEETPLPEIEAPKQRLFVQGNYTGETLASVGLDEDGKHMYTCPYCGESKSGYETERSAKNACSTHIGRWCKKRPVYANGNSESKEDA